MDPSGLLTCKGVFFPGKRITFLQGTPPHAPGKTSSGAPSMLVAYGDEALRRLQRLKDGILMAPFIIT